MLCTHYLYSIIIIAVKDIPPRTTMSWMGHSVPRDWGFLLSNQLCHIFKSSYNKQTAMIERRVREQSHVPRTPSLKNPDWQFSLWSPSQASQRTKRPFNSTLTCIRSWTGSITRRTIPFARSRTANPSKNSTKTSKRTFNSPTKPNYVPNTILRSNPSPSRRTHSTGEQTIVFRWLKTMKSRSTTLWMLCSPCYRVPGYN